MTIITNQVRQASLARYPRPSPRPSLLVLAGQALGDIAATLLDWRERARQRRQLLSLSDAALKDFGRSRVDATHEGGKPFWRA